MKFLAAGLLLSVLSIITAVLWHSLARNETGAPRHKENPGSWFWLPPPVSEPPAFDASVSTPGYSVHTRGTYEWVDGPGPKGETVNRFRIAQTQTRVRAGWPFPAAESLDPDTLYNPRSESMLLWNGLRRGASILVARRTDTRMMNVTLPVKPWWPGFLANTAFWSAAAWGGTRLASFGRSTLRRRRGACTECGYSVVGLDKCPECGAGTAGTS